jgi:hypothetical protein
MQLLLEVEDLKMFVASGQAPSANTQSPAAKVAGFFYPNFESQVMCLGELFLRIAYFS